MKEKVLQRVKEDRNILQTKRRQANCIGHILPRNCCLKHAIVGKLEGRIEEEEEGEEEEEEEEEKERGYWKM